MNADHVKLKWSNAENALDWSGPTVHVYAKFRKGTPITALKTGPRGGLLAEIGGEWKRVRPSRAKSKVTPSMGI